ncbi:alanine racemase [Chloroflexota bacterium]
MTQPAAAATTTTAVSTLEINLDALTHNVRAIRAHIGPDLQLVAVVKANAYGHGLVPAGRTAIAAGADRLAVVRVTEGQALRAGGIQAPVLIMGYSIPAEAAPVVAFDLAAAVGDWSSVAALSAQAVAQGKTALIHVKVDTGMGRFGLLPDEVLPFLDRVAALPSVQVEGIFTHFATADATDKTYTHQQFAALTGVIQAAQTAGYEIPIRHAANSGAILDLLPEMKLTAVRSGIMLYGMYPSDEVGQHIPLVPALRIKSHVARVRTLPAGASIGYDRSFITSHEMPVALVPVGYGDGYPRFLTGKTQVLINGQRVPNVGRVCMDQFVVDISGIGPVALNDEVVLLGAQGDDNITAEELADWAGTINYAITTNLSARMPRIYSGG